MEETQDAGRAAEPPVPIEDWIVNLPFDFDFLDRYAAPASTTPGKPDVAPRAADEQQQPDD